MPIDIINKPKIDPEVQTRLIQKLTQAPNIIATQTFHIMYDILDQARNLKTGQSSCNIDEPTSITLRDQLYDELDNQFKPFQMFVNDDAKYLKHLAKYERNIVEKFDSSYGGFEYGWGLIKDCQASYQYFAQNEYSYLHDDTTEARHINKLANKFAKYLCNQLMN